jgi:hypothetical protein
MEEGCLCRCHFELEGSSPDFDFLANTLQKLLATLPSLPLSAEYLGNRPKISISDSICHRTGKEVGEIIFQTWSKITQNGQPVTSFHVSVVSPFGDDEGWWTLLKWSEKNGTETIALFDVDDVAVPESCSWLLLTQPPAKNPSPQLMSWSVPSMDTLKYFFQAAQHTLGLQQMSREDVLRLYCRTVTTTSCSIEEYSIYQYLLTMVRLDRHARLLFTHFVQCNQVGSVFERCRGYLQEISEKEG